MPVREDERLIGSRKKFKGEKGAKERVRLLRSRGSAELGKVVSATQGLWLENSEVGFQVIGEDRSRLPGRGTDGEARRGGRASDRTKQSAHRFRVRFGRERRASRLHTSALAMTDEARRCKPDNLYRSVSCSESLTSFTNRFFHFSAPPDFRLAFEKNEKFSVKEEQSRKEKGTSIALQKDSESRSRKLSHPNERSKN